MAQGFEINKSLSEASADRIILDNLGGTPIGSDLGLLFNNLRNTSTVTVTADDITGSQINSDSGAVFSNGTEIRLNESTYYVKNSNGSTTFELSFDSDLSSTVTYPFPGEYTRSDKILFENITNYSKTRRSTSLSQVEGANTAIGVSSPTSLLAAAEQSVDFFKYRQDTAITINKSFTGNAVLSVGGSIIINDDAEVNAQSIEPTGPGLFIYNRSTGSTTRAFSGSENSWELSSDGQNLQVDSSNISMGVLKFTTPDVRINSVVTPIVSPILSEEISNAIFTHTAPIIINGETYYLCLKIDS